MRIDFSGVSIFLAYREGRCTLQDVIEHPAYRAVCQHAQRFSAGMSVKDIDDALKGRPSPFYGLAHLAANLEDIHQLWRVIEGQQDAWTGMARAALSLLFPDEGLAGITIYPIIGYDMGIGVNETVCMNLNVSLYLNHPEEFLYFMIHECVHILYERSHRIPAVHTLETPSQWISFFTLMLQNEGFAVYVPWQMRQEQGQLTHPDYQVLGDAEQLDRHIRAFLDTWSYLQQGAVLTPEAYLDLMFSPERLTYRVGCELLRRIEKHHGLDAVTRAFYLDGDEFLNTYRSLLED